jgi:hypothetical protein
MQSRSIFLNRLLLHCPHIWPLFSHEREDGHRATLSKHHGQMRQKLEVMYYKENRF